MKVSALALSLLALASPATSQIALDNFEPEGLHELFGTIVASSFLPGTGNELYGATSVDAARLADINPGQPSAFIIDTPEVGFLIPLEGEVMGADLYFLATLANGNLGLGRTDGSIVGTSILNEFAPSLAGGYRLYAAGLSERLVFSASTSLTSMGLWSTDGTPGGLQLLANTTAQVRHFVRLGNQALFLEPGVNHRLLRTDGTGMGIVYDVPAGLVLDGSSLTRTADRVFFVMTDAADLQQLWTTDGTSAGTNRVYDATDGTSAVFNELNDLVAVGDALYFTAEDDMGPAVWRSNGTTAGTEVVARFAGSSTPEELTAFGDQLLFTHGVSALAVGLHAYDHSLATLTQLRTFVGSAREITPIGSRRAFMRADTGLGGGTGDEVWVTDGTTVGTTLYEDVFVGSQSSLAREFLLSDGKLAFVARDDATFPKQTLRYHDVGATAQVVGVGCAASGRLPRLSVDDPVLGGTTTIRLEGAEPNASVTVFIGPKSEPTNFGSGCFTHVDLAFASFTALGATDASGVWEIPAIAVPNDMTLDGAQVMMQVLVGPTSTEPFGVDVSNGVLLTLGE